MPTSRWIPTQFHLHLLAQLEVESAQRLIEQQHSRSIDQCPRQSNTLLLATRQFIRPTISHAGKRYQRQRLGHTALDVGSGLPCHAGTEGYVLCHRHVRKQRITLEDGINRASIRR
jgi:hypothetical protein